MKRKKCPYCGKRISYFTLFSEKRQGEHICRRCAKESKIVVRKRILLYFFLAIIAAAVITIVWIGLGFSNNPIGIVGVAIPLIIFYFMTPKFIRILPLKKYRKSMEAARAAREYGTNVNTTYRAENPIKHNPVNIQKPVVKSQPVDPYAIDPGVFNSIRTNRKKPVIEENKKSAGQSVVENKTNNKEEYVPIIESNREAHASSSENVPLKKINTEKNEVTNEDSYDKFVAQYNREKVKQSENKKQTENSNYTANRRF